MENQHKVFSTRESCDVINPNVKTEKGWAGGGFLSEFFGQLCVKIMGVKRVKGCHIFRGRTGRRIIFCLLINCCLNIIRHHIDWENIILFSRKILCTERFSFFEILHKKVVRGAEPFSLV